MANPIEEESGGRLDPETPEPSSYPPTLSPTSSITDAPTKSPTDRPTPTPTSSPTVAPVTPTSAPVVIGIETLAPSFEAGLDIGEETLNPTSAPVVSDIETLAPSFEGGLDIGEETLNPTSAPVVSGIETLAPSLDGRLDIGEETLSPTSAPVVGGIETLAPSLEGRLDVGEETLNPTATPTGTPTPAPTTDPSSAPTEFAPTIQLRLEQYALQGGEEFKEPSSYQSSALHRVEEQAGAESMSDKKLVQYYSLYCIFVSTSGVPNAITASDTRFDGTDVPAWETTSGWTGIYWDPCSGWFGVYCEDDEVLELNLYENGMTGIFPAEVILLASESSDGASSATGAGRLMVLDISDNFFLFNDYDSSWMEFLGTSLGKCSPRSSHQVSLCGFTDRSFTCIFLKNFCISSQRLSPEIFQSFQSVYWSWTPRTH
jgi:hypothetical protein